jgi:hypothetical protein
MQTIVDLFRVEFAHLLHHLVRVNFLISFVTFLFHGSLLSNPLTELLSIFSLAVSAAGRSS